MQVINLHDTETEEIVGTVTPINPMTDFDKFFNEVYEQWQEFNNKGLDEDYSIEDYVDFHNENSDLQIDWVVSDFIQL